MPTAKKLDLFKEHKQEYLAKQAPQIVETGKVRYLAVSGCGAPGGEEYVRKIGALYAMAYTIKMTRKTEGLGDYVVSKLECQWWAEDEQLDLSRIPRAEWRYRLLIRTPEFIAKADLSRARKALSGKGKGDGCEEVTLQALQEGRCVQMLHLGAYEREPETLAVMNGFIEEQKLHLNGRFHEIYISDPRRVDPDRLKTILRLPVR